MFNSTANHSLMLDYKHLSLNQLIAMIALLVMAIGISLRFYDLPQKLVWHDEALTLARIVGFQHQQLFDGVLNGQIQTPEQLLRFQRQTPEKSITDIWNAIKEHPEHSPLYYALASIAVHQILPASPVLAMRGTAALLSILLFPALFWLVWEWTKDRRTAWIAVALVAVSPLHLLYAQEAREYALLVVLMTAANAALLHALRRQQWWGWGLYSLMLTLGLYTHLLFVHVFMTHAIYLTWSAWQNPTVVPWRSFKYAGIATTLAIVALSPWLSVLLHGRDDLHTYTKWMALTAVSTNELIHNWTLHLRRPFVDIPSLESQHLLFVGIILLVLWQGLRKAPAHLTRLLVSLAIPVLLTVILPDLLFGGIRSAETRYLMQLLIVLELTVALAIAQSLNSSINWCRYAAFAGFGVLLFLGLASEIAISHADTWWNKSISKENADFAAVVNKTERPLVLWSGNETCGFCQGELISLTHKLAPKVHLLATTSYQINDIPPGYSNLFLLYPQQELLTALTALGYEVVSFKDSWKWFTVKSMLQHKSLTSMMLPAPSSKAILYDAFAVSPMKASLWHIPSCQGNVDANYVGHTNFRCIEQYPLPTVSQGNALINVETYNHNDPNKYFVSGTDLISNQLISVGQGVSVKVRAKLSTSQPGVVGGIFLYILKPGSSRDDTAHDEIDFELIGNKPNLIATNIYGNEELGTGHPASFPYETGTITDYHTYEIQWWPDRVNWLVDEKLVRTETNNVPTGPMALHLNIWVPDSGWSDAYSATIKPTHSAEDNRIITLSVDEVSVNAIEHRKQ